MTRKAGLSPRRPGFSSRPASAPMRGLTPMSKPEILRNLRLPVIGAPLFIISNPDLVIAQCISGVVGAFPALNARPKEQLEEWLERITSELKAHDAANPTAKAAPFAVNQIIHKSNDRRNHDMNPCARYCVPM